MIHASYLETFKSTKDAPASRKNLVAEIIETAKKREEELDSSWWTDAKVKKCLQNLETKEKKEAAKEAPAAEGASGS